MVHFRIRVVAAVFYRMQGEPQVLIFRRGPSETGAGAWEFPGGKVDPGETDAQALRREIREELGVAVTVQEKVGESQYDYPTKSVHLHAYFVAMTNPGVSFLLTDHDAFEWVGMQGIAQRSLAAADLPFVDPIFTGLLNRLK